uniref:MEG 1 isoform 5 n=2 Tax=Schistosoma mansoni TaxID=6183 RepID=D7PD83_SCHMA|nr:MEG 1 isoform 5 [Schistosoma mansoni]
MANRDLILTPYQVFILPCFILIFWSLFLIVFKSDGSGTWRKDIDWLILTKGGKLNRTWFVFNETKEICSCLTDFIKCIFREINIDKDYLCTYPTNFSHGLITYCTKSNDERDLLSYEEDHIALYVIQPTNHCQRYEGSSSLVSQKPEKECPFCFD